MKKQPAWIWATILCLCALGFVVACAESDEEAENKGSDPLESFFSLTMHTLDVTLDEKAIDQMIDDPKDYTHVSVKLDGIEFEEVGFRLKGGYGSFVPWGGWQTEQGERHDSTKSAFIIDFNRYEQGVNHLGLKKLTANNMVQDPSFMRETLAYALFRESGVPASRTSYAQVRFNGEKKGIYILIESTDNEEFLNKQFGNSEGNLYEGAYGADLCEEFTSEFDQDNGDDESKSDLRELLQLLDRIEDNENPIALLEEHFELESYRAFAAAEIYLGHWDGYVQSANNYLIYHNPKTDKWSFMPWGLDQTFVDELGASAGVWSLPDRWSDWSRMQELCISSSDCRAQLYDAYENILANVKQMDLAGKSKQTHDFLAPYVQEEPDNAYASQEFAEAYEELAAYISGRTDQINRWTPCLIGEAIDADEDGYDGCLEDCNDNNPDVHPGAAEACNALDDDCNGVMDDLDECTKCADRVGPDDAVYLFCWDPKTWDEARAECVEKGAALASVHGEYVSWFLLEGFLEIGGFEQSWIGLNDQATEGEFVWTDGTDLDFEMWWYASPHESGDDRDCVSNGPEAWSDIECEEKLPFVCRQGE